jgi:ribosomal protein S18 acetylase RimI-like enzyme
LQDPLIDLLLWDSEFFGIRIGRSRISRLTPESTSRLFEQCQEQQIECLYFLADHNDPITSQLAEANGFRFVDVRLTYACSLEERQITPRLNNHSVRLCQETDLPTLEAIARTSFRLSRFYFDPGFSSEICDRLYITWVHASARDYAQAFLVAEGEDGPLGFITCHHQPGQIAGEIGLVGIAETARRTGIGQSLIEQALAWFANRGTKSVTVVTQARNIPAQRLYQRCGFLTEQVQLWYHRWFNK